MAWGRGKGVHPDLIEMWTLIGVNNQNDDDDFYGESTAADMEHFIPYWLPTEQASGVIPI